jgi:hypothetical protein
MARRVEYGMVVTVRGVIAGGERLRTDGWGDGAS